MWERRTSMFPVLDTNLWHLERNSFAWATGNTKWIRHYELIWIANHSKGQLPWQNCILHTKEVPLSCKKTE